MKKLTRAVVLFVGAIIATQSLQAQDPPFIPNDLYLGFENGAGGGGADYLVNLGSLSSIESINSAGPSDNLSSFLSESSLTSPSLMGTNSGATLTAGIVGGSSAGNPSSLFVTEFRNGGAGYQGYTGSSSPANSGENEDTIAASDMSQLSTPAVGSGLLDSGRSWENDVVGFNANTVYGVTGINPDSLVGSGTLYEDLWGTSSSGGLKSWVYEGYFALDIGGATPSLTFNPVPEPSSYLLSGVGGILVLLLRCRLSRRNA